MTVHRLLPFFLVIATACAAADTNPWPLAITADHRPGTYWWCPGSAFDRESIDHNLRQLRAGGIGRVHIVPIYGAKGYEDRYIPYLSSRWIEMLGHITRRAADLGMQVDMTTGTGWCFGGPDLPREAIDLRARYDAKTGTVKLVPGRKVKRAAPGGEGWMLNPYAPAAMTRYLRRFSKALDTLDGPLPRAQYHDSFEYAGDWCPAFLDEFRKRRGYDLRDRLATFFGKKGTDEERARIKCDYRIVLADLHRETMAVWAAWARKRGMLTRNQAHGAPANLLDVYAVADIPETEMFGGPAFPIPGFRRDPKLVRPADDDPRICMMAASAAHVAHEPGRQLVSAESCTWLRNHWRANLGQIKLSLDLFFLAGVNHLLYHGSCYSPADAPWPGWYFYASTKMDPRNAIWRDARFLNEYVARCQSVLQAGRPANDVLVYWPIHDLWTNPTGTAIRCSVHRHGWMTGQRFGRLAGELLAKGYAFDFVSDRMLGLLDVDDTTIRAPGGAYRAIAVPACARVPVATMRRLADLAKKGATVIFEKQIPADVPGFADVEQRRAALAAQRRRLAGTAVTAEDAVAGLEKAGVPRETIVDAGLRFIRRRTGDSWWYFIANHTDDDFDGPFRPAVPCGSVTAYDPMTGRSGALAAAGGDRGFRLQLPAGGSVVLRATAKKPAAAPWVYLKPAGKAVVLEGPWRVRFIDGAPEIPAPYTAETLGSWTAAPDPKARAFAGTARYTLAFTRPEADVDEWVLDCGDVRESARVTVNGREAGVLVALPYRLRVGHLLRKGKNTLAIEVTGLSANRIRARDRRDATWRIMRDIDIVNVFYKKFNPAAWDPVDAGLLGPVRLVPAKTKP